MDDFIICGLCSSQFYLSNYQDFLNHKISKCSILTGNTCVDLREYVCHHCDFSTTNAEKFIFHYEDSHKFRLLKEPTIDVSSQIEAFEEIQLMVNDSKFPGISLLNQDLHLENNNASNTAIKRDRCCMEDPSGNYCDEITQCPLLMEATLLSPVNPRDISAHYSFHTSSDGILSSKYKYGCSFCNKRFKQKVHLSKHILAKHENSRPFKCDICSYRTVEKGYLKTHMRKHTGERPFICLVCDYRSSQNCALKVHMKRLHPDFMLNCNFCGERFRTTLEHNKHEQVCTLKLESAQSPQ